MVTAKGIKIGIDTGGTFTDLISIDESEKTSLHKVPSTPENPEKAVITGIIELLNKISRTPKDVVQIIHGSTVGVNALLQGDYPETALITTKGFADVVEIGRQRRPHLYSLGAQPLLTLLPKENRFEIEERLDSRGKVIVPLVMETISSIKDQIKQRKIKSVAICLLFSFLNPKNEQLIKKELDDIGVHISLSSEVAPVIREYERTVTTVVNALVTPVLQKYLSKLEDELKELGIKCKLQIMKSNTGVATLSEIKNKAVNSLLGGLAGGVMAGTASARSEDLKHVITFDIGGTSCDVSTIEEKNPSLKDHFEIGGYKVMSPSVEVETIGAGGGSIAKVEEGLLLVGPESQGADPGPACYNLGGTRATVTDANLTLGILDPGNFAGQKKVLDNKRSQEVIEKIADQLELSLLDTAIGIRKILNNNMAHAIRKLTIERGRDPRNYVLIPFGGAGPVHAIDIAVELNIPKVAIPPYPGIWSAMGLLDSETKIDFMQTVLLECIEENEISIKEIFASLKDKSLKQLISDNLNVDKAIFGYQASIQYEGQGYTLPLSLEIEELSLINLRKEFDKAHQKRYQWNDEERAVKIVDLWITVSLSQEKVPERKLERGDQKPPKKALIGTREVYLEGGLVETFTIYDRKYLLADNRVTGPAIIQQMDSTSYIPSGISAEVTETGYLMIDTKPLLSESDERRN
ncbi:MAG: hydantoinase/oxoprolinase family protein [Candidatus Kariarchaeaceae archaeon]